MTDQRPAVLDALIAVQKAINDVGISKTRESKQYSYRGIDDVLNVFSGPLTDAKLMVFPSYSNHTRSKVKTREGEIEHCLVEGFYTFMSLLDGSDLKFGPFYGEASDSLDKATSKAQSVCMRNAYLQTFCCPLGPDMDPESSDTEETEATGSQEPPEGSGAPQKRKPAPKAGAVVDPLSESKWKIVDALLKAKGMTREQAHAEYGEINTATVDDVMDQLKKRK